MKNWLIWQIGRHFSHKPLWWRTHTPDKYKEDIGIYGDPMINGM